MPDQKIKYAVSSRTNNKKNYICDLSEKMKHK
jgi:hypothetical protein